MARKILGKLDYAFNISTIVVVAGGGMIFHLLTALAIKGAYGNPWGYAAFLCPGGAEVFLSISQLMEGRYNYTILLGAFLAIASCKGGLWFAVRLLRERLMKNLDLAVDHS